MDLVLLAIPRRVYTQSHIDYVAEAVVAVAARHEELAGVPALAASRDHGAPVGCRRLAPSWNLLAHEALRKSPRRVIR